MNAPHNSAQAHAWRKRTAAVFAAVGALIFSSGIVMLSAPVANADPGQGQGQGQGGSDTKMWVCHSTSSAQNPVVLIHVDASSTRYQAHLAHGDPTAANVADLPALCIGGGTSPDELEVTESDSAVDCDRGFGTRTRTIYKEYEWSGAANDWVLESEADWTYSDWTDWAYTPLTNDQKADNDCPKPAQPDATTRNVNQSQKDCARGGLLTWADVYTTSWSWDAATWQWVPTESGPVATTQGFTAFTATQLAAECPGNPGGGTPGGGTPGGGTPGGNPNPNPGTPDPEPNTVTPNYPKATPASCSHRGHLVVPAQPTGVVLTRSGVVPGDVTFTFAPAAGYAFPAGTDTKVTVTVEEKRSGEECILGGETTSPKPHTATPKPRDRAAIVLGSQAAVPTAVDAGLAGLPSASVSPISSPRLAQALVAGGLLLLIAGGSMGLGRRTRGEHES